MSYVGEPFLHDLFITYSHGGDDGTGQGYLAPWSSSFKTELEREFRINPKFRESLRIFIDKDHRPGRGLDPMEPLSDELRVQVAGSAFLVALISPDYLMSDWCTRERDWWHDRQRELDLSAGGRVAAVRIMPTDAPWPPSLKDAEGNELVGFRFYDTVEASSEARPLGYLDIPSPFHGDAKRAIVGLVGHLSTKLDDLRARLAERRRAQADAAKLAGGGDATTIYLHGRAENAQAWEKAAVALTDVGFAVTPSEPTAVERDLVKLQEARAQRVRLLSDCDALLLVGSNDGRALDEDLVAICRKDRNSARALSNRLLPCGLLDTVGAPIASSVRKATARILQAEWIDATRDPWTPDVQRWLGARSAQAGA